MVSRYGELHSLRLVEQSEKEEVSGRVRVRVRVKVKVRVKVSVSE